jgi:hypothetical protein
MNRLVFFVTLLMISSHDLCAQASDSLRVETEEGWIENMSGKIGMDLSLNNAYEIFEVSMPSNNVLLHPNAPSNLRLKLNYEFISVGFQIAPDFIPGNGDDELKGKTNSFAIGTSLIFKHFFVDLSYSKVKGYYLQNTADYIPWEKGDPYIQFPDLQYEGFAISSGYINNSKFSLKSLRTQTERQLKSAGSFIPVVDFRFYSIDDKSSNTGTQKSNNLEVSLGPGYYHTFVSQEKFYFSIGMQASLGYLRTRVTTRFETGNKVTYQDNFVLRWDGKTGIGYNGSRFYTGVYATVSGTRYNQQNTTVMNFETRVFYQLFLGIRLEAPDCLKRQMTRIKDKMSKD